VNTDEVTQYTGTCTCKKTIEQLSTSMQSTVARNLAKLQS